MSGQWTISNSEGKSLLVSLLQWLLLGIGIVDSSPNSTNVGFWLYGIFGLLVLMPIQFVLFLQLIKAEAPLHYYVGATLSVASLAVAKSI